MKILKKIKSKIRDNKGETLAEALIAMLVAALGSVMLASMITSSFGIIKNSEKHFVDYTKQETQLVVQKDASGTSGVVVINHNLTDINDNASQAERVLYWTNELVEGKNVYTYRMRNNAD